MTVLPFHSRADLLHRRGLQAYGRWMMSTRPGFNPNGPEARIWAEEGTAERIADAAWAKRHDPVEGGVSVVEFPGAPDRSSALVSTNRAER